jgi:DNA modification methylase
MVAPLWAVTQVIFSGMSQPKKASQVIPNARVASAKSEIYKVHNMDARELLEIVAEDSVDVTVTSPPYFDLKDYGNSKQIGYGQDYLTYLSDLRDVFEKVHTATKKNGSLWIVIDTFRRSQELLPLPFDLAAELKKVGWSLKDVIIWKKERTVPWVQSGATRNIFEYILVFAKQGETHQYYPDRQREIHELKHWWVKYPERYNQKGKSLEEIWSFDIPTQGSWGDGYIRHFCPLPEGLVQRIIDLTTDEGDVVLDPFSGSGTVPAQAKFMGRKYIGFELNKEYIDNFDTYIKTNSHKNSDLIKNSPEKNQLFRDFSKTIIELRILKLGRILLKEIQKEFKTKKILVLVEKSENSPLNKFKIAAAEYKFIFGNEISKMDVEKFVTGLIDIAPYSKFGVQSKISFSQEPEKLSEVFDALGNIFCYTITNSHQFKIEARDLNEISFSAPVISQLRADINENDYK